MLQENKSYKAKLIGLETPEGKNMRTLRIAIPSEKTIFKGVSVFLDNAKNASKTLDIWLRNIIRQKELDVDVPAIGHIEYLQEFEGKYKDEKPEDVALKLMLEQLEGFAKEQVEFDVTYIRTFSEKHEEWYNNLVPYTPTVAPAKKQEQAATSFKNKITK